MMATKLEAALCGWEPEDRDTTPRKTLVVFVAEYELAPSELDEAVTEAEEKIRELGYPAETIRYRPIQKTRVARTARRRPRLPR